MIILKKIKGTATAESSEGGYEVPNGTIAWGAIILAVIQAAVTIGTSFLTNSAQSTTSDCNCNLKQKEFHYLMLRRAMELELPADRAKTIKLLIVTDLIPENEELSRLVDSVESIPHWPNTVDTIKRVVAINKTSIDSAKGPAR